MKSVRDLLVYAWKTRRAWWFTATARTRERFARTALGSFWLGLSTLLSVSVLAAVYGTVFQVKDFQSYSVYLGVGLVIWNAMASATQSAATLLTQNAANLKNTNLHPIFFSLEEWSFQVQTFFQSFALVVLALLFFDSALLSHLFMAGLLPLFNLLLFLYWLPLLVCLLGARYQDFFQLVPILIQLLFLLSPILYVRKSLGSYGWIADLNPFYRILACLRDAVIEGRFQLVQSLVILLVNALGLLMALVWLERQRRDLPFLA